MDEETAPAVQDAPAAPFEDEETAPAVPAVSEDTKITFISKNYVPVITEEIKNAVAVAAEYKYIPYYNNKYGVRCSREHTSVVCAAELLLQRENLYIENYALICGNGQTFAYISKHDEEIKINYDVAQDEETAAPADSVPAVSEDAQETAANVETPAVSEETAPAVQDAPAVAVSLPVPVSAVYPLHAVYIDNCLHGVYFSQLLADEVFFNNFFAGLAVDFLTFPSSETAPAVFRAADSVPAEDEETAAPAADPVPAFASIYAIMPEIWETAPAVQDAQPVPFLDEETPAPFAAEDAPAVAAFYLASNFARRARRVFNVAAALLSLLLITAAPRFISSVPVQDAAAPADSVPAAELRNSPETAPAVAADSLPAVAKKQPRNARKRARRVNPDNLAPAVAVSLPVAADSVPADSVPAGNSPAPAVPVSSVAVPGCPGVPAALLLILML